MAYKRQDFKDGEFLYAMNLTPMEDAIIALESQMATFHPIDITSISNNIGTVELGVTVDSVVVSWVVNKAPAAQTLNGEPISATLRSAVVPGPFTSGVTFTVAVEDENEKRDSASTSVNFHNGVYCGSLPDGSILNSATIRTLTRKLQGSKATSFTALAGRPTYALPSRYGTPSFNIGGFDYTWTKAATIQFENASGYVESYDIWQHPQLVTGSVTVTVK